MDITFMKKIFILVSIFISLSLGLLAYLFFNADSNTKVIYKDKIIIGYAPWPGYAGLFIADSKEYFKEAGLDIELKAYPGFEELSKDYVAGSIQGRANITLEAINEAYGGLEHRIVAAIDYSNGSDGIIASRNIKAIKDIKGKRVAFEHGTLEEFFLRYALDQNQLGLNDIIPINLNPEESAEAISSGIADVAVTYEPFMSKALAQIGGNKIYSSADAPGLVTDVLTFRLDFINEHSDAIQAIVGAYFKGIKLFKDSPQEANIILAKYLGVSVDQVPAQLNGVTILSLDDNKNAFTFAVGLQSLYGNMRQIGEFIKDIHSKDSKDFSFDTDLMIEPLFIRKVLK
ncbi:MAG: hypothetical protein A3B23_03525 [Candidatus Colwellbacteria bacterium RIFCSPLOWO2_01_FULL_48_10]|uniref:SsuA/THI5-like domain-containing protein n=2 Tax=Bacteria candidate phyla TaxID=1783234 RepID=A0A1F5P3Q4_9BACT|nr:MAG: hypothetical protein A2846_04540 [Candidatus Doudnabacteria bacterium RIFCSPHIGHO2_01_FULL_49_9]OGY59257.1 MAG: hypothetical protein A3B23_03525 [Candidatus Colwellbacteria bacterium RIFCSPLOWO2_01_FULL_48_10]